MSRLPSVRRHVKGYFFIRINGKDHYLGKDKTKAHAEAQLLFSEYLREQHASHSRPRIVTSEMTIEEIVVEYLVYAKTYYTGSERSDESYNRCRRSLQVLLDLHGRKKPSEFGPLGLKQVRQHFIDSGLSCSTINDRINIVRQCFRWAAENEYCDSSVYHALQTVSSLKKGRNSVKAGRKVSPVSLEDVEKTIQKLSPIVADLVRLQMHSGMRSSEMLKLRGCDIDMSREVWRYSPESHKTRWKDKDRVVYFGPICQEILGRYLANAQGDLTKFLFSPKDAVAYHQRKRAEQRKTKPQTRRKNSRKENPKRVPGDRYKTFSYRTAILRACARAGVPRWYPHQLRHLAGTLAREVEGLDGSQHFLGHSNAKTAEIYSEIRDEKAEAVAKKIG